MLLMSNAEMLIHAIMTSRLDYCNALLGGCSARLINKLKMIQNGAARVLTRTRFCLTRISLVLSTLHWLPIKHCIDFKIFFFINIFIIFTSTIYRLSSVYKWTIYLDRKSSSSDRTHNWTLLRGTELVFKIRGKKKEEKKNTL